MQLPKPNEDISIPIVKKLEIKSVSDDRTIILMATDETLDRDNDIVKTEGIDYKNFLKSGSILYGHDPRGQLPVGVPTKVYRNGKSTLVDVRFAEEGTSEFTDVVYRLVKQKILRGVSIGFIGKEWINNEYGGRTFTKSELLEVSLTPIPSNANAHALVKELSNDIQTKLFQKMESVKDTTEIQEEAKDAEPEPEPEPEVSKRDVKFVETVNKLKKIIGV